MNGNRDIFPSLCDKLDAVDDDNFGNPSCWFVEYQILKSEQSVTFISMAEVNPQNDLYSRRNGSDQTKKSE